ncbi:hypothetical protein BA065_03110 [Nanoarchaeota archaeon NZ13-N]|uniref:Uncharacterized protein n=1 Tax=Candidatus Nanoclepta minutus TaxID=1940235 RepID=A0A397WMS1_9ARCH|nr:MAG: hypothetical protein BA065_03110 [Nanoarchaeota archaeon NZ13-N]RIB35384.1 MAG: hypothetical protein BXU00_01300 [Candidatus Nanoclepta minutus]
MVGEFSHRIKGFFGGLGEAIEFTKRYYNIAKDIEKRCLDHKQPPSICRNRVFELAKRYDDSLDIILNGNELDYYQKDILKEMIAYDGLEIPRRVIDILRIFYIFGKEDYQEKIASSIFQPLKDVYLYLKTKDYDNANEALNYAKRQLSTFHDYLFSLPYNLREKAIKTIIQKIESSDRPFYPDELIETAEQAIKHPRFRWYR